MTFLGLNFDLKTQLGFYGAYHRHPVNKLVHFFFAPMIFWSVMVWLEYPPFPSERLDLPALLSRFLPDGLASLFVVNWAVVLVLLYSIYYIILEPFAGMTWFILLGIFKIALARLFFLAVPYAWAPAIGFHVLGWVMQILIGHQTFEQRRPALMDSFFQSLVLAGLFAWMEGLFALGYRPELQAELHKWIEARDAEISASPQSEALLKNQQ